MVLLVPSVVEPHRHEVIACCPLVVANAVPLINGTKVITFVSMSVSLNPCAVTVTKPAVDVSTLLTYFEPEPAVTSQPQPLAAIESTLLDAV